MITISPGRLIRKAIITRLANVSTGFNANLATASTALGIPTFAIDFTTSGQNFYESKLSLASIQKAGYDAPQIVTVWAGDSLPLPDGQRLISHTFSGTVTAGIDVILQTINESPAEDTETPADAVDLAMRATIDTPYNQADFQGCGYDGHMLSTRPEVVFGGENWIQAVRFILSFEVHLL